jgi:hypothetical protein
MNRIFFNLAAIAVIALTISGPAQAEIVWYHPYKHMPFAIHTADSYRVDTVRGVLGIYAKHIPPHSRMTKAHLGSARALVRRSTPSAILCGRSCERNAERSYRMEPGDGYVAQRGYRRHRYGEMPSLTSGQDPGTETHQNGRGRSAQALDSLASESGVRLPPSPPILQRWTCLGSGRLQTRCQHFGTARPLLTHERTAFVTSRSSGMCQ